MENGSTAQSPFVLSAWIILQLLTSLQAVFLPSLPEEEEDDNTTFDDIMHNVGRPIFDPLANVCFGLQNFRFCPAFNLLEEDVQFWVKPRFTIWFSRFLLNEYDDKRWVHTFRMTKPTVFALADFLAPHVQKKTTKYRVAIPVVICVACTLFKLTRGASLFICSEFFAIGKSTVSSVLRDVIHAINDNLRHNLSWSTGDRLRQTQQKFLELSGLPGVMGAIDGTHISISKPSHFPVDYYYFKSGGYTLNCQAVVDREERFWDLYLGMPGSTNDSRMLRHSFLYNLAMHNNLFDNQHGFEGFSPYLVGDLGYPLLPWLMVPHRTNVHLSVAENLFNRKLRRARCVVENVFGILKQTFKELLKKSDLDVAFLPNVIICCAILHNMLLGQSHEEVEYLFEVLRNEGMHAEVVDDNVGGHEVGGQEAGDIILDSAATIVATNKRRALGVHLTMAHQYHP